MDVVLFLIWFGGSFYVSRYAEKGGHSPIRWWFISLAVSPFAAFIYLLKSSKG